jgi:hypothetical protein
VLGGRIGGRRTAFCLLNFNCRPSLSAFGSTNTLNPVSTTNGFCDKNVSEDRHVGRSASSMQRLADRASNLACLVCLTLRGSLFFSFSV